MTSIECPGLFAADDSLIKLNWISDGQTTANRSSLAAGISHTNHMSSRVWKILAAVACFPSCAVTGQQPQILSRFGGWAQGNGTLNLSSAPIALTVSRHRWTSNPRLKAELKAPL